MVKVFTDRRCLSHRVPVAFPEKPERLEAILSHLANDEWELVESTAAADDPAGAVATIHEEAYLTRLRQAVERGDRVIDTPDNPLSSGTWEAARAAVAATVEAADWVMGDQGRIGFVAARPPGHHAERGMAMGFCFFNNVAIAADRLLRHHGLKRTAIFDFDVHHGNGTQHTFEAHAEVLYISTHQYPFYPGTGAADEVGVGEGRGATLNLPLAAGSGDEVYRQALVERVLPTIEEFRPEVLLLSAGFDAWKNDPLGGMRVSEKGFYEWGLELGGLAAECCGGRALAVLEGGYDLDALPRLVSDHLHGLAAGLRSH